MPGGPGVTHLCPLLLRTRWEQRNSVAGWSRLGFLFLAYPGLKSWAKLFRPAERDWYVERYAVSRKQARSRGNGKPWTSRNPGAGLSTNCWCRSGVGAITRQSRTAGRKSLAQPFKAGDNGILNRSPVGTTENTCGANALPCLRHSEFLVLVSQR